MRFRLGAVVFGIGFMSPLFIPLVTSSDMSLALKGTLSTLLALGIPESFMVAAAAIMGKEGYEVLRKKLSGVLKTLSPREKVSRFRFRIGLIFFFTPILVGWILPYLSSFLWRESSLPILFFIALDILFLLSFFVLGGDFWDRFRDVFKHRG
ncbi:MAG: hypothetical protein RIC15_01620 [Vicingaceae bacterium]